MAQSPYNYRLDNESADLLLANTRRITDAFVPVTTKSGNGVVFLNSPAIGITKLKAVENTQLGPVALYNILCAGDHLCGYLFVSQLLCKPSIFHTSFMKRSTNIKRDILMSPAFVEKRLVLENVVVYTHPQGVLLACPGKNLLTDMLAR